MFESFALTFVAIFVAMDIIGTLPLYVSMTASLGRAQRSRTVDISVLTAFVVAIGFLFLGKGIFHFIGITLFDFKIAGGLVLLLISLADLVGQQEAAKRVSGSTGVVPLAVPLITGPGVITTLILQVETAGIVITLTALLANFLIGWGILRKSDWFERMIGKDGTVIVSKLAALLLAGIAVAMIRTGLFEALRSY